MGKTSNYSLCVINVGAFVASIIANLIPWRGAITQPEISAKYPLLLTPANFTFGIWLVIYAAIAVFLVWQFLSPKNAQFSCKVFGAWFTIACLLQGAWVPLFLYESFVFAAILMVGIFTSLAVMNVRVIKAQTSLVFRFPVTIWFAWNTAATLLSLSLVLRYSFDFEFFDSPLWTCIALAGANGFAMLFSSLTGNIAFPAVLAWTDYGIYVANNESSTQFLSFALVIIVSVASTIQSGIHLLGSCLENRRQKTKKKSKRHSKKSSAVRRKQDSKEDLVDIEEAETSFPMEENAWATSLPIPSTGPYFYLPVQQQQQQSQAIFAFNAGDGTPMQIIQ